MPSITERTSSRVPVSQSPLVEAALTTLCRAAQPLCQPTRFAGRLGRRRFWAALLVAGAGLVLARLMDLLVFGSSPGKVPAFFVLAAALLLGLPLTAAAARRLRDAGARPSLLLLALLPAVGWLLLLLLLCRSSHAHRR